MLLHLIIINVFICWTILHIIKQCATKNVDITQVDNNYKIVAQQSGVKNKADLHNLQHSFDSIASGKGFKYNLGGAHLRINIAQIRLFYTMVLLYTTKPPKLKACLKFLCSVAPTPYYPLHKLPTLHCYKIFQINISNINYCVFCDCVINNCD